MAYFLVMGGLALSLCLLVGWSLWRVLRWLGRRVGASGKGRKTARAKRPAKSRAETRSMKKDETSARATTSRRSTARQATPRGPWRLTRGLAPLASTWPLALVAGLLYGGTRLAEYGMGARPHTAPAAYHRLVEALGWGAIGLIGVAVVGLVASWRCR
ncbi:hypothetical protein FZZ93_04435 [Halomonas eurihalina]|uniref:Uncharacterized protein n=1 Tax=Halomonas eurihalina TaxID=42566 RepID=A0A5D9D9Y2_HALER|nr:hypothetical protein [Halomonas eurihalina]MDR5858532.1 hypothetical protein [Halomonas eurihalina]TZG40724.1 hypothetical protein FZZ93_04435 [Halomonas eurihalina]